jgi:hypothetical protein
MNGRYGLRGRGWIPGRGARFFSSQWEDWPWAHPAGSPVSASGYFPGVKLTTHHHLKLRSRMVELYLRSPIGLHGVLLSQAQRQLCFYQRLSHYNKMNWSVYAVKFLYLYSGVPGSNLGWVADYPDRRFSWFSLVSPGECRDSTLQLTATAFFHIFSSSSFI